MPIDLSALNPEVFCGRVAVILLSSIGVDLVFKGIMDCGKIKLAILLRGLVRI